MGAYGRKFDRKAACQDDLDRVFELFPRLAERRTQLGGTLSGGEQQMLAIGRALMARPRLLLLDEPSMGLAPMVIQQIFRIITEINDQGTTDPAGRAERAAGAVPRATGPTCWRPGEIAQVRHRAGAAGRPGHQGGLPGRRLSATARPRAVASGNRRHRRPAVVTSRGVRGHRYY